MSKKILILGGGFAGIEAAIYLRKENFEVDLVSDRDYMYIFPTSIWIPIRGTEFSDVCIPLKDLSATHGFNWIKDEVKEIHSKENRVVCSNNEYNDYDYLIVAIGSGKIKHKNIQNTLSICGKPEESLQIRDKIDELIKKGSGVVSMGFGSNPDDTSAIRGGPAFEVLFNLHNRLKKLGIRDKFTLNFFAPMQKPGAKMGDKALVMMEEYYKKLDINKYIGKEIIDFTKDAIIFEDNSTLKSDLIMFIAAGSGNDLITYNSDLPLSKTNFININDYCELKGDNVASNVYAIGDCAQLEGPKWKAKQGHVAEVMARNVAYNITQKEKGYSKKKGYQEHLNILCVMDDGLGAGFIYRDNEKNFMLAMPIIGHWMKKGWGWYAKNSKLGKIPRIPWM